MQHHKWISALNLQQWASSKEAKTLMPEVIRRLIHATVDKKDLEMVQFPSGEQTYRPGYDGVTKAQSGNFMVPKGITNWEVSSLSHTKKKLDLDYAKRIKGRESGDYKEVTYIAVTPHSYRDKDKWITEKLKAKDWGDVRLYDSDNLEQWLEVAPSVAIWLSRIITKIPEGVGDLFSRWKILKTCLKKALPATVLLTGREKTIASFQEWLEGPPATLKVVGHSPQEVIDVFTAWVETLTPELQDPIATRAVVIDSEEGWKQLATSVNGLILIASEKLELDENLIALAKGKSHHILIPSVNLGTGGVRLERLNRSDFGNKLVEAGLSEQEAYSLASQSGGSFTVFKRLFTSSEETKKPKWGEPDAAADLAPLLLVGSWQERSGSDKEIVAKIAGKNYDSDCLKTLNKWRKSSDAPVRLTAGIWEFLSPLDAWRFLHHALTSQYLDEYEKAVAEVLGENNPAYELPKEDRWQAAIKGKKRKYSSELRHGLAQTLAVLATQPATDQIPDSIPLPTRVERIVAKLLAPGVGWERWASLGSDLLLLAEAAPQTVINAIEVDLKSPQPQIPSLFDQEHGGAMGRVEHTGLLWTLERLALSAEYVARASDLLARLSELDPGGQWGNRPQASLRDVFFSWMPYTTASLDERLNLISKIVDRHKIIGWKLLLNLLPQSSESITKHSPPEWRFWAETWKEGVSGEEYFKTISALVNMALEVLKKTPDKWIDILRSFDFLPVQEKERVLSDMEKLEPTSLSESAKQALWKALGDRTTRYRVHPDARWVPPAEVITRLERIRDRLEPTNIVDLIAPRFGHGFGMFGARDLPWEEQVKIRQQDRAAGVRKVLDQRKFEGVLELANKAQDSLGVGISLGEISGEQYELNIIPHLLVSTIKTQALFASGYLFSQIDKKGRDWAEGKLSQQWTTEEAASFAVCLPFDSRTWAFVKSIGDNQSLAYWKKIMPHPNGLQSDEVAQAVEFLIQVNRSPSAISLLAASTYHKNPPTSQKLFELFESALQAQPSEDERISEIHDVHAVLGAIYATDDIDETRLAKIEWNLLPILDRDTLLPHALHRLLAREPGFFVEILTLLFRADDEPPSEQETETIRDQAETRKRENAWHLLHDFGTIPGTTNGSIDAEKLRKWIVKARELALANKRLGVCDSAIGQILAHSPEEKDGSWPAISIREMIEEIASERLDNGFFVGILNLRGVSWKAITEGGNPTRVLAQGWEKHAKECQPRWPRTAGIISAVVQSYLADAAREDEEAERRS